MGQHFSISILFLVGWFFVGPLAVLATAPLLCRKGPSRAKLPSAVGTLNAYFFLSFPIGVALGVLLPADEVPQILKMIADLRIVPTAASAGVSEGIPKWSFLFAMEIIAGLFFVPVILRLVYRQGSFRFHLDTAFEEEVNSDTARPILLWSIVVLAVPFALVFFYFEFDLESRKGWMVPYLLPGLPLFLFFATAFSWRASMHFFSDKSRN